MLSIHSTQNRKQVVSKSTFYLKYDELFFNYGSKFIKEFSNNKYELIHFIFAINILSRWLKKKRKIVSYIVGSVKIKSQVYVL